MFFFPPFLTRCLVNFYILQSYRLKKVSNLSTFLPPLCVLILR